MPGTKEGFKKARKTIEERYGPEFWKEIARKGGSHRSPKKGFGSNRELAASAGQKGGRNRWRKVG